METDAVDEVAELLRSVGCDERRVTEVSCLATAGDLRALTGRLSTVRADLVEQMHESQRRVDRLDLLIRRIRRLSEADGSMAWQSSN